MKNYKSFIYAVLLGGILAANGCKSCNPAPQQPPVQATSIVTYENGATIPDYQKQQLQTYEMDESAKITEDAALKNATRLLQNTGASKEFDLKKSSREGNMVYYNNSKDPSARLSVNLANGDISLNRGMNAYMGLKSTSDLVKNDEAVKMAKTYLQKLGYGAGEENSMVVGHVGGVNLATHSDTTGDKIYEKLTTVRLDRVLDGIPVIGHSRLLVQMGERGSIQTVIKQWAPYKGTATKSEAIVSTDVVKRNIEEHLTGENKGAKRINIQKINLIYYDNGKGIIEPALHIIGVVMEPKSKTDSTLVSYKHDMVEPLLKNPRLTYTFMADKHPAANRADAVDNNAQIKKEERPKRK